MMSYTCTQCPSDAALSVQGAEDKVGEQGAPVTKSGFAQNNNDVTTTKRVLKRSSELE